MNSTTEILLTTAGAFCFGAFWQVPFTVQLPVALLLLFAALKNLREEAKS